MAEKHIIRWADVGNKFVELNSLNDVSISDLSDGDQMIYNAAMNKFVNSSYQAGTLQSTYGTTEGIHMVTWGGVQRPMNISFYKQKAWVEILYVSGSNIQEPWDNWINSATNGLQSYNITEAGGLNYESENSAVLVVPEIITNLLITAKTGKSDPVRAERAVDCSHMNTQNRGEFIDYFTGVIPGFEQVNTFGISGNVGNYDTHLGYRNGEIQTDEWLVQDGSEGSSIGQPIWGYRTTGNVDKKGAFAGGLPISPTNVFSVFATNY